MFKHALPRPASVLSSLNLSSTTKALTPTPRTKSFVRAELSPKLPHQSQLDASKGPRGFQNRLINQMFSGAGPSKPIIDSEISRPQPLKNMFGVLDKLGDVAIINGGGEEPTPNALDLMLLFCGRNTAFISDYQPPNLLKEFPDTTNIVHSKSVGAASASNTMVFVECANKKIADNAKYLRPGGRVIIAGDNQDQVAQQVALLNQIRPDVGIYGHAPDDSSTGAAPLQACFRVAAVLNRESAAVTRPLKDNDARWLRALTGAPVNAGTAICSYFDASGALIRKTFKDQFNDQTEEQKQRTAENLNFLSEKHKRFLNESAPLIDAAKKAVDEKLKTGLTKTLLGKPVDPQKISQQLELLGPVAVYGANGNIGSAIVKALAGKGIPVHGVMRKPNQDLAKQWGTDKYPLTIGNEVPASFKAKTAFITASTGWPRNPETGDLVFDRKLLLGANIHIVAPILASLPDDIEFVVVISNPSSELGGVLPWLLRPDLTDRRAIGGHAGTDDTRLRARFKHADNVGTLGPHSPAQTNWGFTKPPKHLIKNRESALSELLEGGILEEASKAIENQAGNASIDDDVKPLLQEAAAKLSQAVAPRKSTTLKGRIDARIPGLGKKHQEESRDKNSVTIPTALASIEEAVMWLSGDAKSYAIPLNAEEAERLTSLMQKIGYPIQVHEGIGITIPRDEKREIRWDMLQEATEKIPQLAGKFYEAIKTLELDRSDVLNSLVNSINNARPNHEKIDVDWVLANRGKTLSDTLLLANKK